MADRVQPQQGNAVIVPGEGRFLATVGPDAAPENGLLLRRKFGKEEYAMFSGVLKDGAYARLKAFRLDSGDRQACRNLKYYDSPERDWYFDLDDVYFEDDLVLVEGRSEIFYKSGDAWKKAEAMAQPPARLSVISQPPGAQVWIDGVAAGATPLQMRGIGRPLVRMQLRLQGYYMVDEPVQIRPGQHQVFRANLAPRVDADTQSLRSFDAEAISALLQANAPGQAAYVERQVKIVGLRDSLAGDLLSELVRFDRGYPPMKAKDEFEKTGEFEKRQAEYEAERVAQRKAFSEPRERQLAFLSDAFREIDSILRPSEERRVRIPSDCAVKPGIYDADAEIQSVNIDCSESGIRYQGACNLPLPRDAARRLRQSPESLRVAFYGWNILSPASDGQIANMTWDTLGFSAFGGSERPGACTQASSGNAVESFFLDHAARKAAFYVSESRRRRAEDAARRDSLAAARLRAENENERRKAEEAAERRRLAAEKRKRIFRFARIGMGSALLTGAAVLGWNGVASSQEADEYAQRYENSLSVESAARNKDEFNRRMRRTRVFYALGGIAFTVSVPLLLF